jgi:hypothetical protein
MLRKKIIIGKVKKTLALVLTSTMIATLCPSFVGGALTVHAATEKTYGNTSLGAKRLEQKPSTSDSWNRIYYGQNGYTFRYLNTDGAKGLLFDCDYCVGPVEFDTAGKVAYADSSLKHYLNGDKNKYIDSEANKKFLNMTKHELNALNVNEVASKNYGILFPLTKTQLDTMYDKSARAKDGKGNLLGLDEYWTSTKESDSYVYYVHKTGEFGYVSPKNAFGVSPAFYLKPEKVLMTTNVNDNSVYNNLKFKLTLLTDNTLTVTNVEECERVIKFKYAHTGSESFYNNLSVLVTYKERTSSGAKFERLETVQSGNISANGEIKYTLPNSYDSKTDKVYLVAQQLNANDQSDYAMVAEIKLPSSDTHIYSFDGFRTDKDATCTEKGSERGINKCEVCGVEKVTETRELDALGHDYGDSSYKFSADGKTCTATTTCKREGCKDTEKGHTLTETVKTTSAVKTPAEPGKKGVTTYTATFKDAHFTTQTKDIEDIPALHAHDLKKTAAKAATATTAGNSAYWTCSSCGKYFSDSKGTKEIAKNSWVIAATGNTDNKTHTHKLVKTNAKDATETSPGNTAFWTCTDCGKFFSDSKGTTEIKKDSWVIPAKGKKNNEDNNSGNNNSGNNNNNSGNNNSGNNNESVIVSMQ